MIDLPRARLVHQQTRGYPGGFYYTTRFVTDSARHFAVDIRNHAYIVEQYPPAQQQLGNLFMLPQFYLLTALENSATQRQWRGQRRLATGAVVNAVTMTRPNGALIVLTAALHRAPVSRRSRTNSACSYGRPGCNLIERIRHVDGHRADRHSARD